MGMLRDLSPHEIAKAVVGAVRHDKQVVVLPKRARASSFLAHAPQMVADRLFRLG
jgi:hypothetical protein